MIKTPVLTLRSYKDFYESSCKEFSFCLRSVRKYFDIPLRTKKIQFVAYKKSTKDSVPVKMFGMFLRVDGREESMVLSTQFVCEHLMGSRKNWHVECYYWI